MKKEWTLYILIFLSLIPLLVMRDYTPNNELKYLSIADEALKNGNFFAFYNHGMPYADKPPLYLWFVMGCKVLFGGHYMFALSMFSIIPAFITIGVMNRWVKRELTPSERVSATMLLFTSAFFLASAIVLRMDMLMTMFITLALYAFYRMYQSENVSSPEYKRHRMLLPVYIFFAVFSKGAVGILVPLVSIVVFLVVKREIKTIGRYLGWRTWGILLSLCVLWFVNVYIDGGYEYLDNLLFNQTINRAVDSFHHKEPFYYYAITYWYAIAPWSLLVVAVIVLGYKRKLLRDDLAIFFAVVAFSMLIMMSFVSAKIVIYLLPCFPFLLYLTAILLPRTKDSKWVKAAVVIPAVIIGLLFPASLFLKYLPADILPIRLWAPVPLFTFILFAGCLLAIYYVRKENINAAINSVAASMMILIFAASFSMNNINYILGAEKICSQAKIIAEENNIDNYAYYDLRSADNFDVFLGKHLKELSKEELQSAENILIFTKTKNIDRDDVLKNFAGEYELYGSGEYTIIIVNGK